MLINSTSADHWPVRMPDDLKFLVALVRRVRLLHTQRAVYFGSKDCLSERVLRYIYRHRARYRVRITAHGRPAAVIVADPKPFSTALTRAASFNILETKAASPSGLKYRRSCPHVLTKL